MIVSGGLGPTFDDLTRECVSVILKRPLVFSNAILNQIKKRFQSVRINMPRANERQAYLVKGAKPILNRAGTAPGQIIALKGKRCLILLPGPPNELIPMLDRAVVPYLKKNFPGKVAGALTLHIFGHPESEIDQKIRPVVEKNWDTRTTRTAFGILAHGSIIDVEVMTEGRTDAEIPRVHSRIEKELRGILGRDVYGKDGETLEIAVGRLLAKKKQTLSLAESCTGGLVAHKITEVPGSSEYFLEGAVTYSNISKIRMLGLHKETLKKFGAVSAECAEEMARGILRKSGSDWAVSVTGIAGPGGGTPLKPVGLVYFCVAGRGACTHLSKKFYGTRSDIKERAALTALDLLRRRLI